MGIAAGLAAGLVGAAAWAMLAWYANVEIGWLAWGIGAAVGIACAAGSAFGSDDKEAKTGPMLGIVAVLITVLSICGGKFATVEAGIQSSIADAREQADLEFASKIEEPVLISWLADQIGEETHGPEWQAEYDWPEGVDFSEAVSEESYPRELWATAEKKWDAMSEAERSEFESTVRDTMRANLDAMVNLLVASAREEGFLGSFGGMDLLFFGLAVVTAWQIAGSGGSDD